MPATTLDDPLSGLAGLLNSNIIGSQTKQDEDQSLITKDLLTSLLSGNKNESQTTSSNGLQQLIGQLSGQQTTSSTASSKADTGALEKVFAQQQAGISPEMLSAIFTEGAKAVPGLVNATANAVGARSAGNSPLATSLGNLSADLTTRAATINQQMLADSANTAGKIADLTKSTTNTGTTSSSETQNNSTTNTTTQNLARVLNELQNQTQNRDTQQSKATDTTTKVGINPGQAGATAGIGALLSLLAGGSGGSGGVGGITGSIGNILDLLKGIKIPDFGTPPTDTSNYGNDTIDYDVPADTFDWGAMEDSWDFGLGDGWKDGGRIPQLTLADEPEQDTKKKSIGIEELMALAGKQGSTTVAATAGKPEAATPDSLSSSQQWLDPREEQRRIISANQIGMESGDGGNPDWGAQQTAIVEASDPHDSWMTALTRDNEGRLVEQFQQLGYQGEYGDIRDFVATVGTQQEAIGDGGGNIVTTDVQGVNPKFKDWLNTGGYETKVFDGGESGQRFTGLFKDGKLATNPFGQAVVDDTIVGQIYGALFSAFAGPVATAAGGSSAAQATNMAIGAGQSYASGADFGDILKNAAISYGSSQLGSVDFAKYLGVTDPTMAGLLNNYANGQIKGQARKKIAPGKADGGKLPTSKSDPKGIKDEMIVPLSGGEFIISKDVVDAIGPEFFQSIQSLHHTPAAKQ